jgi:hypothetical protein
LTSYIDDAKSIHSTVSSEYSCIRKISSNHHQKDDQHNNNNDDDDDNECDDFNLDLDDLDNLMPDSPSAPTDNSFLLAQRSKHKQQQLFYRQTAQAEAAMQKIPLTNNERAKKTVNLSAIMQRLSVTTTNNSTKTLTVINNENKNEKKISIFPVDINVEEGPSVLCSSSSSSSASSSSSSSSSPTCSSKSSSSPILERKTLTSRHTSNTPPVKLISIPKTSQLPFYNPPSKNKTQIKLLIFKFQTKLSSKLQK